MIPTKANVVWEVCCDPYCKIFVQIEDEESHCPDCGAPCCLEHFYYLDRHIEVLEKTPPVCDVCLEIATEPHPVEAEEGWLGCTDFESDDPGGWTR